MKDLMETQQTFFCKDFAEHPQGLQPQQSSSQEEQDKDSDATEELAFQSTPEALFLGIQSNIYDEQDGKILMFAKNYEFRFCDNLSFSYSQDSLKTERLVTSANVAFCVYFNKARKNYELLTEESLIVLHEADFSSQKKVNGFFKEKIELKNRTFNFRLPLIRQRYVDHMLFVNPVEMEQQIKLATKDLFVFNACLGTIQTFFMAHEGLVLELAPFSAPIGGLHYSIYELLQKPKELKGLVKKARKQLVAVLEENKAKISSTVHQFSQLTDDKVNAFSIALQAYSFHESKNKKYFLFNTPNKIEEDVEVIGEISPSSLARNFQSEFESKFDKRLCKIVANYFKQSHQTDEKKEVLFVFKIVFLNSLSQLDKLVQEVNTEGKRLHYVKTVRAQHTVDAPLRDESERFYDVNTNNANPIVSIAEENYSVTLSHETRTIEGCTKKKFIESEMAVLFAVPYENVVPFGLKKTIRTLNEEIALRGRGAVNKATFKKFNQLLHEGATVKDLFINPILTHTHPCFMVAQQECVAYQMQRIEASFQKLIHSKKEQGTEFMLLDGFPARLEALDIVIGVGYDNVAKEEFVAAIQKSICDTKAFLEQNELVDKIFTRLDVQKNFHIIYTEKRMHPTEARKLALQKGLTAKTIYTTLFYDCRKGSITIEKTLNEEDIEKLNFDPNFIGVKFFRLSLCDLNAVCEQTNRTGSRKKYIYKTIPGIAAQYENNPKGCGGLRFSVQVPCRNSKKRALKHCFSFAEPSAKRPRLHSDTTEDMEELSDEETVLLEASPLEANSEEENGEMAVVTLDGNEKLFGDLCFTRDYELLNDKNINTFTVEDQKYKFERRQLCARQTIVFAFKDPASGKVLGVSREDLSTLTKTHMTVEQMIENVFKDAELRNNRNFNFAAPLFPQNYHNSFLFVNSEEEWNFQFDLIRKDFRAFTNQDYCLETVFLAHEAAVINFEPFSCALASFNFKGQQQLDNQETCSFVTQLLTNIEANKERLLCLLNDAKRVSNNLINQLTIAFQLCSMPLIDVETTKSKSALVLHFRDIVFASKEQHGLSLTAKDLNEKLTGITYVDKLARSIKAFLTSNDRLVTKDKKRSNKLLIAKLYALNSLEQLESEFTKTSNIKYIKNFHYFYSRMKDITKTSEGRKPQKPLALLLEGKYIETFVEALGLTKWEIELEKRPEKGVMINLIITNECFHVVDRSFREMKYDFQFANKITPDDQALFQAHNSLKPEQVTIAHLLTCPLFTHTQPMTITAQQGCLELQLERLEANLSKLANGEFSDLGTEYKLFDGIFFRLEAFDVFIVVAFDKEDCLGEITEAVKASVEQTTQFFRKNGFIRRLENMFGKKMCLQLLSRTFNFSRVKEQTDVMLRGRKKQKNEIINSTKVCLTQKTVPFFYSQSGKMTREEVFSARKKFMQTWNFAIPNGSKYQKFSINAFRLSLCSIRDLCSFLKQRNQMYVFRSLSFEAHNAGKRAIQNIRRNARLAPVLD